MTNSDQRGGLGPSSHDAGTQEDSQIRFKRAQAVLATVLTQEQMNSISEEQYRQLVELQMEHGDVPIIQPEAEQAGMAEETAPPAAPAPTLETPAPPPFSATPAPEGGAQEPAVMAPPVAPVNNAGDTFPSAFQAEGSTVEPDPLVQPRPVNAPDLTAAPVSGGHASGSLADSSLSTAGFEPGMAGTAGEFTPGSTASGQTFTEDMVSDHQAYEQQAEVYAQNAPVAPPESGGMGIVKTIMVLGGALLVGGAGAVGYKQFLKPDQVKTSGGSVTIKASRDRIKKVPENPGGRKVANAGKQVYDRLRRDSPSMPPNAAQLRGGTDRPVKIQKVVPVRPRVVNPLKSEQAQKIARPNKVQTFTVLPDGRILRAPSPPKRLNEKTASIVKKVIRPRPVPAPQPVAPLPVRPVPVEMPVPAPRKVSPPSPVRSAGDVSPFGSYGSGQVTAPARVKPRRLANAAPTPIRPLPGGPELEPLVAPSQAAPRRIATPEMPARTARLTSGYVVQVAALRSQEKALERFANLQQKYPDILGKWGPDIQRADLGDRGIYYRLRIGPMESKTDAAILCSQLKSAGHAGCYVRMKK